MHVLFVWGLPHAAMLPFDEGYLRVCGFDWAMAWKSETMVFRFRARLTL